MLNFVSNNKALGATHNGIKSIICLPAGAPISKIEATKALGAEVCLVPGVYDDAYAKAIELQKEHGYTFVHPFDDPKVIAGQGTIGLEIIKEMDDVDVVIVPIGGGGLISGVAFAIKTLKPDVKVVGVQAAGAPSMVESVKKGERIRLDSVSTIADGIAVKEPGINTYEMVQKYVDEVVTVTDDEVAAAILYLIEKQKLVAEGAGAVPMAAVLFDKVSDIKGKKVVCLVSGGNIDVTSLNRVIARGLVKAGRDCNLVIQAADKPGQLAEICACIGQLGGNILSVKHDRVDSENVNGCRLLIEIETRNHAHIRDIKKGLRAKGFGVE